MYNTRCDGYQPKYGEGEEIPLEHRATENLRRAIRDLDHQLVRNVSDRMEMTRKLYYLYKDESRMKDQIRELKKGIDRLEQE